MNRARLSLASITALAVVLALPPPGRAATAPLQELLDLVPADAVALAVVGVTELRASNVYRACEDRLGFGNGAMDLDRFVRLTGLDPTRDIDAVVLALRGRPDGNGGGGAIGLVKGRFDQERLNRALVGHRLERDPASPAGWSLYGTPEARGNCGHRGALAFSPRGVLLFGDASSVGIALSPGGDTGAPRELRHIFETAPHRGQVYGAAALPRLLPAGAASAPNRPAPLAALASVQWVSFDADFGSDLRLVLSATSASPDEADLLRQSIDGMLAFTRLGSKEDPDLIGLLAETTVQRDGDRVTLKTTVSPDLIERLTSSAGAASGATSGTRRR